MEKPKPKQKQKQNAETNMKYDTQSESSSNSHSSTLLNVVMNSTYIYDYICNWNIAIQYEIGCLQTPHKTFKKFKT